MGHHRLLHRAVQGAHHTLRDGGPSGQTERIANGHHPVAHHELARIAQFRHGQIVTADLHDRQVRLRVSADQSTGERTSVGQGHHQRTGTFDHMVVRQNMALRVVENTRTHTRWHAERLIELVELQLLAGDLNDRRGRTRAATSRIATLKSGTVCACVGDTARPRAMPRLAAHLRMWRSGTKLMDMG